MFRAPQVGYAAEEKVRMPLESYPDGTALRPSEQKILIRKTKDMLGTSATHSFDESLKSAGAVSCLRVCLRFPPWASIVYWVYKGVL